MMLYLSTVVAIAAVVVPLANTRVQDAPFTIQPLPNPSAAGSAQPQLTVSARGPLPGGPKRALLPPAPTGS
jgi:hypothetical protein